MHCLYGMSMIKNIRKSCCKFKLLLLTTVLTIYNTRCYTKTSKFLLPFSEKGMGFIEALVAHDPELSHNVPCSMHSARKWFLLFHMGAQSQSRPNQNPQTHQILL